MRSLRKRILLVAVAVGLTCALGASIAAQPAGNGGSPLPLWQKFAGEKITYDGKVSRLKISVSVGEFNFETAPDGNGNLVIKSEAVSKGTLLKLFRYSFLQQYESTVDPTFRIVRTTTHDVQKSRVRDSEALFDDTGRRVTFVETDPKDRNRPPRRIASEIGAVMHDMISAIYWLRLQPLAPGDKFDVAVSDSGLVYSVPVNVTGRRVLDTALGKKTACLVVEPLMFGDGRLIEQKGKMVIFMTDDDRHIPVKAEVDSEYGKINIKLKTYSK